MTEAKDGCVKPAKGPLKPLEAGVSGAMKDDKEVMSVATARVGHEAPDFEVNAYLGGGFQNVKLSDYKGNWVVLCFYPGDFTFV